MRQPSAGITLIELLVTISVLSIVIMAVLNQIDIAQQEKRRRDTQRFLHGAELYTAIEQYKIDYNTLPGTLGLLYTSVDLESAFWVEIAPYLKTQPPKDPLNQGEFIYRYKHSGYLYELDFMVESNEGLIEAESDGGNGETRFELGTDLNIL